MSELYNDKGVEFPTRTTPHNQVIAVKLADPAPDTIQNYVQVKQERGLSWDQVGALVDSQDPALGDYLRAHGSEFEKDAAADSKYVDVLTERAINPLTTQEERDRLQDPGKAAADDAKADAKAEKSAAKAPAK
jgi:hypothetical protein